MGKRWLSFSSVLLPVLVWGNLELGLGQAADSPRAASLPSARWDELPRWRGFNLQAKFYKGADRPFQEEDFRLIAKLGFNFVRLPMDYRVWIRDGDWTQLDERVLREIDQAVQWGSRYGIHVMINFHRAPGYTVARPPEKRSLWTDPEAQRVCALHWAAFARRYRGIPSERLSFNLFNEPSRIDPKVYVSVCRKMVEAIRSEDPHRLIVADGLEWGKRPVPELIPLRIAQATRGYVPMSVSHYKARWVRGEQFPRPSWPRVVARGLLLGPAKTEPRPLVIDGPFGQDTRLRLHVQFVSHRADLVVEADGKPLWKKVFVCGPGRGEWKKAVFQPRWKVYQNLFDRDYFVTVPAGTRQVQVRLTGGDWLQVSEIGLAPARHPSQEDALPLDLSWGKK
ncbi:MAG: glycoside hydrolase family 5 protein, partial [Planctomycetes bacterium]|nr:glycoside hydrolase family 5 protein [Planctomycetota bacterium]